MKKIKLLLFSLLLIGGTAQAQLAIGDIAFIGYNTDAGAGTSDDFTFITLNDIPGSEVIFFTEEGWSTVGAGSWAGTSEGHIEYTAPAGGLPCGTVVHINETAANTFTVGCSVAGATATLESGSSWSLTGGDQVLAYQAATAEPATTPTFISGVNGDDGNGTPFALDAVTLWNDPTVAALGTGRSALPAGLTNGVDCVSLFPSIGTEEDNAKYTGTLTGTSTVLRAAINDRTNWSTDDGTRFDISISAYTASVTCVAACSDPDVPTITFGPPIICDGNSALLIISGDLNDATAWHVYTGSCGGTEIGTTTSSSIIVTPPIGTTTYFIRGEGGCVTPGSCGTVTITTTTREDATFSYAASTFCADATDPTPTITGVTGGTFSSTAGISLNSTSGVIDLSASTPGTYTVSYTTSGTCAGTEDFIVTINALDDASFSYDAAAYCADATDPTPTITGVTGGTFSSTAGLSISASTGAIDVSTSTPGTYTVTYLTAGTCPNSATATVTINALDDASFSYDAAAYCVDATDPTPTITGLAGGTFSSTAGLSISASTGAIDVSTSTPGTYTITYMTAGTCANSSTATVTINALDDASFSYAESVYCPNATDPTPTITGLAGGTFSSTPMGLSINTSTGAIDISASTVETTYTITYTTAGACPSSANTTVLIEDTEAPIADLMSLPNVTAQCEVTALTPPTATDNCGGTVTVTNDATLPITTQGTTAVMWTYADENGNSSTQMQNVVIDDITAPTPDVATLSEVTAECEVTSLTTPTATDNCGGTVTVTNDATLPITATTTVTWTYDDGNGNTSTQEQDVTINDVTDPVPDAASLADITAECEVTTLTPPTATDNCAGTVTVTNDATLPITATTVVTWTYDDGNGNTVTQEQNVVIEDTVDPIPDALSLEDITAECEVTSLTMPTATDNCGSVMVTNDATLPITTTTLVTWTYDDGNGNTVTQEQNVVIEDTTAPVADIETLDAITAECEVTELTAPTATDNCGGEVTVTNDAFLPIFASTTVTWTYDDGNGNTSTQTQEVVIEDTTAPIGDELELADITEDCEVTSLPNPSVTDNCSGEITITNDATFPITSETVVTWTYTDLSGNSSTQTQNILLEDLTAPVPDEAPLADVNASCELTSLTPPGVTDNCGTVTITNDATFPITEDVTVTWTYEDENGNTTTQTQDIIIGPLDASTTLSTSGVAIAANTFGATYQWIDCDNGNAPIDGETGQVFIASEDGNYAVIVTIGDCSETSECVNITGVGIEDFENISIEIYPNPVHASLFQINTNVEIEIVSLIDMSGREISVVFNPTTNQVELPALETGNYIVNIITRQGALYQQQIIILK